MIVGWLAIAIAGDTWPVRSGDTVESIAAEVVQGALVSRTIADIRRANGLAAGEQPGIGMLLRLPDTGAVHQDQQAFVLTRRGTVTIAGALPKHPATLFETLPMGSVVCTGADSYATLRVSTQCTRTGEHSDDLTLAPDTCVQLVSAHGSERGRSTVARVLEGSIQVQQNPTGQGHVTVQAGTGQTTGASGGYRVTLEDDAAMRAEALYAPVAVQGAGAEVDLDAGQGSRVREGEAPSDPIDLLAPGSPTRPDDGVALRKPWFAWTPVPDAFGYRFEVATGRDFVDLVYSDDLPDPDYRPSLLMLPWPDDGVLHWRIASFDRFGFLGIPSAPRSMALPTATGG
jgi:hypothetical protein